MRRFGVTDETIASGIATLEFRALMCHEVEYARSLFEQGLPLIGKVNRDLALDLDLFSRAGLRSCAPSSAAISTCSARARHSKQPSSRLLARARRQGPSVFAARLATPQERQLDPERSIEQIPLWPAPTRLAASIAKREAKNFYYAFLALPIERRNAICAIYAFMRQADDLADDESLPREERRQHLDRWLAAWHQCCKRRGHHRSGFSRCARCDAAVSNSTRAARRTRGRRVHGSEATLATGAPDTYATFADLYRYCYLVASVVGLVCIRIFGYRDLRAEKLAEETGIAFQLTNILRDVAEDAARNRVYLPLEDLAAARGLTRLAASSRALLRRPPPTERELARRHRRPSRTASTVGA